MSAITIQRFIPPSLLSQTIVVFSRNYLPVARINLRRAAILLLTGRAEPLELGDNKALLLRSPSLVLQVPAQIRLTTGNPERLWKVPPVSRREVLRRDHYTCQYCGSSKHLTLDHVLPKSRGGQHSWDNVVAACESCNQTKGARTPAEAGMRLRTKPKAPIHPALAFAEQFWTNHSTAMG